MQTKFLNNSITHIGLLVICFGVFGLWTTALGINAPIHGGPFQDVNNNGKIDAGEPYGQYKLGKLTIIDPSSLANGSQSNSSTMFLEIIGTMKIIPKAPLAGVLSGYGIADALGIYGSGYSNTMIVLGGDPSPGVLPEPNPAPTLTPTTALDIRGNIKLDPSPAGIDFDNSIYPYYTDPVSGITSTTEKQLCTTPAGLFVLCP